MSEEIENKAGQENAQPQEPKMTIKQKTRIVFMTLLAIVLITFTIQNFNRVEIEFLNMNFRIRIIYIILGSAGIGAAISFLLMKHSARKKKKK
jgi:uncharacterized integral membrane protein